MSLSSRGATDVTPGAGTAAPFLSGLAAVSAWGLAPVATRAAVAHLEPLPLAVVRALVAGLVFLPWCVRVLRRLDRAGVLRVVAAGLLGMVGYNLPVAVGVQWLPASTSALVLAGEPVWILVLSRLFLGERAPRRSWAGSAVALAGIAVIAGPDLRPGDAGARTAAGLGLVLLGTLFFAAYTIVLRPLSTVCGPSAATAASTAAGAVPYLALVGTLDPHRPATAPPGAVAEVLFLALGSTVLGMLLWNVSVARIGSRRAGLLLFLEPVVGVAGGVTLLGERLSAASVVGGVLVMAGVVTAWTADHGEDAAGTAAAA
ncbi:DMT family transporter [Streptomyces sp. NPDC021100]|uniref:DMT family transporter n=1 Tax=Streptomyces sp. NPDC021100 TaxID=3365114 RepID=UPI0037B181F8